MAAVNQRLIRPLQDFLHKEASAGLVLVGAAVVAIVWANSPLSDSYFELWATHVNLDIGSLAIHLNLKEWINDAAMVLFFFVAGLEIKRELTEGELRDPRQAALPIIAALGGMMAPAIIYFSFNHGGPGADGWGIPMATDIAIVMGVVALLGSRAPSWLKLFLLALAIVDDIGAIIVIAVFYSEGVSFQWLTLALGAFAVAAVIRDTVSWTPAYVMLGMVCWLGLQQANVHPTLAGVAFGMIAPVVPRRLEPDYVDAAQLAGRRSPAVAHAVSRQARESVSVVEWLEHKLHPYSAFVVVPVFALANAGIEIPASSLGSAMSNRVTWGVILGLVIGKTIGITVFTLTAVKLRIGKLPIGVNTRYVIGAGALGGIGFTVSLFVTELAFGEDLAGTDARLGVLVASVIAAIIGTLILVPGRVTDDHSMDATSPSG
jgi:NhaA family Na+:H+ antiporter